MKITKTAEQAKAEREAMMTEKEKAHIGCYVCPCCGRKPVTYMGHDVILSICDYRNKHKDRYRCESCGAEWETDLYMDEHDDKFYSYLGGKE